MYKVYLAGPWFHEGQPERLDRVEKCLDSFEELKVFSPRRETLVDKNSTEDAMDQSFKGNVTHVQDSDFIVAITDGNDAGTMFESGLAYAFNVPILYYYEGVNQKPFNLMLAKSCKKLGYTTNIEELTERINQLLTKGIDNVSIDDYKGEIE